MDDVNRKVWERPGEEVAAALGTDPRAGLAAAEAGRRLAVHGPNRLREARGRSLLSLIVHQFRSVIVALLAVAAGLSLLFGDVPEAVAILVVLLLNGTIGFVTELRAERSMDALARIAEVRTRVRRDGRSRLVDARALVPGDIVVLEAGDIVTADLRLLRASNLSCDESVLTGESVPVAKSTEVLPAKTVLGDRTNMAFKGSSVAEGAGEGVVVATGMATEVGRISDLAESATARVSPLEQRLDRLGRRLVGLTLGLAAAIVLAGIARGHALEAMVQTGVALAIAAVPEGLPVVATLCLARGMWRMAERNALISRLSAVETLGAATLILTDKTGTLTENRMTVAGLALDGMEVDVSFDAAPAFAAGEAPVDPQADDRLAWALRVGLFCNTAELGAGDAGDTGDPMEVALLHAARLAGLERGALLGELEEVRQHAFSSRTRMMATVHRDGAGYVTAVKGAPEAVLGAADRVLGRDGPRELTAEARRDWERRAAEAAGSGARVLGLAVKRTDRESAAPFEQLTLVGFVLLRDPISPDVPEAIRASRGAGVRVAMVTGDHVGTAARIAVEAELAGEPVTAIEGAELEGLDPERLAPEDRERLLRADVFARVSPETKLTLVDLFQSAGEVVAMTGDGVNDAPALRKADIGIAMGRRGTDVAREAAVMVLKDDAFPTIVEAMRQGRVIYDNIRKFVVYLMSCNVSEVMVVGLAVGAGLPAPLLPLQILFLNLVTDVFPAFALGFGQGNEAMMRRPPRDPGEALLDASRWRLIFVLGGAITAVTLAAFAAALYWLALPPPQAVTVAFVTLALAQMWNVFNMRSRGTGVLVNEITRNPWVWGALALCLGLLAAALWVPPLAAVLDLPDPGPAGLGLALGASLCQVPIGQVIVRLRPPPARVAAPDVSPAP